MLLNALVDADVAIVSSKPETTRKAIRAVLTNLDGSFCPELQDFQMIFVDTPGLHKPKTLLGERLNQISQEQISNTDIILFLTPADEEIGPGDRRIVEQIKQKSTRKVVALTKIDKVEKVRLRDKVLEIVEVFGDVDVVPVSAKCDDNLVELIRTLVEYLPEGELLYSKDDLTDESWQSMVAEVVRQAALESLDDELPHSLMVQVNEKDGDTIFVNLFVERDSQKGIIIGKRGENIKKIRRSATPTAREIMQNDDIELSLSVKVAKNWQKDTKLLHKFGF
jgi:GTP-binding protein Era